MSDPFSKLERSRIMALITSGNTKPELTVRRLVHGWGYRYRLHVKALPGTPDLVFQRLRKVLFVQGCFWHMHKCRRGCRIPTANRAYWLKKLLGNAARDRQNRRALLKLGYEVLYIWECQTRHPARLARRIRRFLGHGMKKT